MRSLLALPLLLLLFPPAAAQEADAFVTTLGTDTLAVERFWMTDDGMTADVVLRTPRMTRTRYTLTLDEAGDIALYKFSASYPEKLDDPFLSIIAEPEGDSLAIRGTEWGKTAGCSVARAPGLLPFIEMVHWPFELMLERARASGQASVTQPLFDGCDALDFTVGVEDDRRMTVTHPFRGTMIVKTDAEGRLQHLDAGATKRALTVTRVDDLDFDTLAAEFAARDAAGQSFDPLPSRAEQWITVDGARIVIDYGQPAREGRELFGALVPWGEVWRTGANRATHFSTDRDLMLGDLLVPAGAYTLFSIPEPDGGTLIINRETGQKGTAYDASQDLGRVPMRHFTVDWSRELFTITLAIIEASEGREFWLQWGNDVFAVPFTVVQ